MMKTKLLLMLTAIALAAGVGQANMLLNPGFEEGTFKEKNIPDDWSISSSSWTSAWTWFDDADEAHWGDRYIKMVSYVAWGSSAWMWQTVEDVTGGQEYAFSVWAKCPIEDRLSEVWGYYEWLDAGGAYIGQGWLSYSDMVGYDWEHAELGTRTAPETATQAIFWLCGAPENGPMGVLFDDAYMGIPRPGDPSPEWDAMLYPGNVDLSWTNLALDPNDPDDPNLANPVTSVYVEVLFGTDPAYDMEPLILDPGSGQDVTSVMVDANDLGTYYWQVNSYLYGDPATTSYDTNPGDPNVVKGHVWSFTTTDDFPPSVTIDTPAMVTWQNEPVQLDATVFDEYASPLLIEWTVSGTGVTFDPNEFVEDPEVSIDKGLYTNADIVNPSFEEGLIYWVGDGAPWDGIWGTKYIVPSDGALLAYTWDTGTDDNGLSQTLPETLAVDTTYTLTVDVANDGYWNEDVSYRVQLRAGEGILAEDYNEHELPAPGGLAKWETSTVVYTCGGDSDPNFVYVGKPLEIHLLAINDTWQMCFDDVRLIADPGFPAMPGTTYELTVTVTDDVGSDFDTVEIDIYDDACQAAQLGVFAGQDNPTDLDGNCNTAVMELAELAASWLHSTKLTAAEEDLRPTLPALNSGFQLYKPGTDFTVTAELNQAGNADAGGYISTAGGVQIVQNNGFAIYPDGTFGKTAICPGWVDEDSGSEIYGGPFFGGENACYHGLGSWDPGAGDTTIITDESLGVIEADRTYTISIKITGIVGNGPLVFDLLADGVSLTPTTIDKPASPGSPDYVVFTKTYDEAAVVGHIGKSIKIRFGVPAENDKGAHLFADDVMLDIAPSDANLPDVDAGIDMVTWSGEPVALDPTVVNNDPLESPLTYEWSTNDPNNTVFSATDIEAPTVIITKATLNPSPVILTLTVALEGVVDTVSDTMKIDVYDDNCKASAGNGYEYAATDFDGDCVTSLGDFALLAEKWLEDYALTKPAPKPATE